MEIHDRLIADRKAAAEKNAGQTPAISPEDSAKRMDQIRADMSKIKQAHEKTLDQSISAPKAPKR